VAQQHEHDTPWKEALTRYLPQFFAFFFPAIHADIDWSQRVVFLDKELRRIAPEVPGGSLVADHLVQVHRNWSTGFTTPAFAPMRSGLSSAWWTGS
jgi:hypothetical protein